MATNGDLRLPFFKAAYGLLSTQGYGGLKQAALCREVGVTTGAFYHSFESWKAFTTQFLEHWHEEQTARIAALARDVDDPVDRLELLIEATIGLPHRAEAAMRAWSTFDADVSRIQRGVDEERFRVVRDAFLTLTGDQHTAELHAQAGLFMLIGFEQQEVGRTDHLAWSLRLLIRSARSDFPVSK